MKEENTIYLPRFTIGENAFDVFRDEMGRYGIKVAVIHGEKAWESSCGPISSALEAAGLELTGVVLYGHEATDANVNRLVSDPVVSQAEVLLAVGGGKCIDVVKLVADRLAKPVFTVPTIASNCAPVTKLSIIYAENGAFDRVERLSTVPVHCFINPRIILGAPLCYLRAGIGDAMAKHVESEWSAKAGEALSYGSEFGLTVGRLCFYPMLDLGEQAMKDAEAGVVSEAVEKTLLNIIITAGIVSVAVHSDYVGGLAHALFYGLTRRKHIEQNHLHGDVVAYGTLVNLALDNDWEKLEKTFCFNRAVKMPTCLADLELEAEDPLDDVLAATLDNQELSHTPYPVTKKMIREAMDYLEGYGAERNH